MKSNLFYVCFFVLVAFGCEKNQTDLEPVYEEGVAFELAFSGTATCACGAPEITFAEVVEDSRCPLQAECVWAGEVIVKILVDSEEVELGLSPIDTAPDSATVGQWKINLLEVNPYPEQPQQIPDEDYELKLLVEAI